VKRTILSAVTGIALALSSVAPATAVEARLVYQQVKLSPFVSRASSRWAARSGLIVLGVPTSEE
jgi:hypothetical protein